MNFVQQQSKHHHWKVLIESFHSSGFKFAFGRGRVKHIQLANNKFKDACPSIKDNMFVEKLEKCFQ